MSRENELRKLIEIKNRRLQKLREKNALKGINSETELLIEIEDLELELEKLHTQLDDLDTKAKKGKTTNGTKEFLPGYSQQKVAVIVLIIALAGIIAIVLIYQGSVAPTPTNAPTSAKSTSTSLAADANDDCSLGFVDVLHQNGHVLGSIEDYSGYTGLIVYLTNSVSLPEGWIAIVTENDGGVIKKNQLRELGVIVPTNNQDTRSEPIIFYTTDSCSPLPNGPFVDPETCLFVKTLGVSSDGFGYIMPKTGDIIGLSDVILANAIDVPDGWIVEWIEWDESGFGHPVTEYGPLRIEPGQRSYSFYAPYDCRPLANTYMP